jgi:hypothetical protein
MQAIYLNYRNFHATICVFFSYQKEAYVKLFESEKTINKFLKMFSNVPSSSMTLQFTFLFSVLYFEY